MDHEFRYDIIQWSDDIICVLPWSRSQWASGYAAASGYVAAGGYVTASGSVDMSKVRQVCLIMICLVCLKFIGPCPLVKLGPNSFFRYTYIYIYIYFFFFVFFVYIYIYIYDTDARTSCFLSERQGLSLCLRWQRWLSFGWKYGMVTFVLRM